jgi:ABC-type branched-subunit amino acid transport system substrate-binding protein
MKAWVWAILGIAMSSAAAAAQDVAPGVAADRIVFGQSAALTGPAADLGVSMRRGILAAFTEVNGAGGVHGRQLELVSYDDAYEPEAAIANTQRLIQRDQVFALIGAVGTPTAAAAEPIAYDAGVPFIAPFTGAEFLRDPARREVVNVRASYFQETEAIVERLTRDLGITRIAVLYQDDSYGRAGLAGIHRALDTRGMSLVSEGTYVRNTVAVKTALLTLRTGDPEAIIVIGAYKPSAVFTRWVRKLGLDALIVNISFVGTWALRDELGAAGDGVLVSQVVPFPSGDDLPLQHQYRDALRVVAPVNRPGFGAFEGYIAGRLTAEVLEQLGPDPTREGFLDTLAHVQHFDIGGFQLEYGLRDNQGSDSVWFTMFRGEDEIVPLERLER